VECDLGSSPGSGAFCKKQNSGGVRTTGMPWSGQTSTGLEGAVAWPIPRAAPRAHARNSAGSWRHVKDATTSSWYLWRCNARALVQQTNF